MTMYGNGQKREDDECFDEKGTFIPVSTTWDAALLKSNYPCGLKDFVRAVAHLSWGRQKFVELARITDKGPDGLLGLLGLKDRSSLAARRREAVRFGLLEVEHRRDPDTMQIHNWYRLLPPDKWRKFECNWREIEKAKKQESSPEHVGDSSHVVPRRRQFTHAHVGASTPEPRVRQFTHSGRSNNEENNLDLVGDGLLASPRDRREARKQAEAAQAQQLLESLPVDDRATLEAFSTKLASLNRSGKQTPGRRNLDIRRAVKLRAVLIAQDPRRGLERWREALQYSNSIAAAEKAALRS